MKRNLTCQYGYRIAYSKPPRKALTDRFLTRTYREALFMKQHYLRFPDNATLEKPEPKRIEWHIIPIRKREAKQGIWRKGPPWEIKRSVRRHKKWILI